jgi:hypothetical protein
MPVIKRPLRHGHGTKVIASVPTPTTSAAGPIPWEDSFDLTRTLLDMLDDGVVPFTRQIRELLAVPHDAEVPLDGQALPRELILALFQVSLLEDPDFDYTEDFEGLAGTFAEEQIVRLVQEERGGHPMVVVLAGDTRLGIVPLGGFLDRWDAQARCWVIWRLGTDPDKLGKFIEQQIPER